MLNPIQIYVSRLPTIKRLQCKYVILKKITCTDARTANFTYKGSLCTRVFIGVIQTSWWRKLGTEKCLAREELGQ